MCLYAPARLAQARATSLVAAAGPLRLMTVARLPASGEAMDPGPIDPVDEMPGPLISMLWLLPDGPWALWPPPAAGSAAAAAPQLRPPQPRLLRAREGAMSEQGGVMAELFPMPWVVDAPYELLLLELLTLQPLGRVSLSLRPRDRRGSPPRARRLGVGGRGVSGRRGRGDLESHEEYEDPFRCTPTFVSIQRRAPTAWVFVLEVPDRRSTEAGAFLEVWSVRTRESAESLRARSSHATANDTLRDPEEALRAAPPAEASLLQVIHMGSPKFTPQNSHLGIEDITPVLRAEWPTFDRHRSSWLAFQHLVRIDGVERPGLVRLDTAKHFLGRGSYVALADSDTPSGDYGCPRVTACTDLRLLWRDGDSAEEPLPWLLLERPTQLSGLPELGLPELVSLECWQLRREKEGEGGGELSEENDELSEENDELGEVNEGGEEVAASALRLCRGPHLRTTPASAELRRLSDQRSPTPLVLTRPRFGEPLLTAANWRWLVLLDATGVHILDFGGPTGRERAALT